MLDFISGIDEQESRSRWVDFRRSMAHEDALVSIRHVATGGRGHGDGDLAGRSRRRCARDGLPDAGAERSASRCATPTGQPDRIKLDASKDPLGDLARASGFHVRPVTLARTGGAEPAASRCWANWPTRAIDRSLCAG